MPSYWCPGAIVVSSTHDGGSMTGGPAKFTVHSYEANPDTLSAKQAAKNLIAAGNEVHLTFNPKSGEYAQLLPANRAGRGLKNASGGVETNREGSINIQVEVIAFASSPFTGYMTDAAWSSWGVIMDWVASFGVARTWPSGNPPVYPPGSGNRSTSNWTGKSGLFSHSQAPENSHGDPGAVDGEALAQGSGDDVVSESDMNTIAIKSAEQTWNRFTVPTPEGDYASFKTTLARTLSGAETAAASATGTTGETQQHEHIGDLLRTILREVRDLKEQLEDQSH